MKKILATLLAPVAGLGLGLLATTSANAADTKACFVYVGPIGDFGWSYQHDQGRLAVEKTLGVETAYQESVPEGADAERAIERFARSGCNIIFTTSFGYMEPTNKVAKKFPDVKFEHATGFKRESENVSTYGAKFYQGRYVQGQIAATESKTGVAGYIASFPIPEVVRGINSFILGAQSVNPDFKLKVVWVNSWFDPGKEADAANTLVAQGVDILTQHTDSTAAMQVAQEKGIKAFGQASDMRNFGKEVQLTAIIDWKQHDVWLGMDKGDVAMAPYWNMPYETAAKAKITEGHIRNGALEPFTGPITKQDGTEWLKEGERADVGTLLGMNFYVKGVDDQLPQ